jgi:hypothetical protein
VSNQFQDSVAITMTSSYHTEQQRLTQRESLVIFCTIHSTYSGDLRFSRVPVITADFWEVPLCSLVYRYQRFQGTCCLHPMEAECSIEMSETLQQATWCYVPEVHVSGPTWVYLYLWARGSVVVKALSYKSEGRGIASR